MNLLAYIDPGTTAIILQVLAGIVITLGVVFGIWWRKITTFFKSAWVKIFGKNKAQIEKENSDDLSDEING